MNIIRIEPVIQVATPLGDGDAIFLFDYCLDVNSVWVVRLAGGEVKHLYSEDIRIYGNKMNGKGIDTIIPDHWKSNKK